MIRSIVQVVTSLVDTRDLKSLGVVFEEKESPRQLSRAFIKIQSSLFI